MQFKVKNVAAKNLEKTLNEYEPYCLKLFTILPDSTDARGDASYKIVYTTVPEEELRESPKEFRTAKQVVGDI